MSAGKDPVPGRKRGKKPVHLVAATGYSDPQDAAWVAIRTLKQFTVFELVGQILKNGQHDVNEGTVKSFLIRLKRGGYVAIVDSKKSFLKGELDVYCLIRDAGIHAPRLTTKGKPTKQGMGRENLWRSMKMLRDFTSIELADTASTPEVTVKKTEASDYIMFLRKAGYLQVVSSAAQQSKTQSRYRLIKSKNTGPRPPMIQRLKRVFDPNLNRVMLEVVL